jgi:hypothetical protein
MCDVANVFLSLLYLHEFLKLPHSTIKMQKKKYYVYLKFEKKNDL